MTKYYTPKCFHCDRGDVTLADDSTEDADKYVEASTYNADVSHWRQRAEATEVECLRWTETYKSQYEDLARNRTALAEMTQARPSSDWRHRTLAAWRAHLRPKIWSRKCKRQLY